VSDVRFVAASPADVETGLRGWVRFVVNGILRVDGVVVRQTMNEHTTISFPAKRDSAGRMHKYVRPVNTEVGREIEHQVLTALGYREGARR
jgi:hypothetical protein